MKVVKSYHQLFPTLSIYNEAIKLPGKSISRTQRHYQVHTLRTFLSLCKENLGMQAGRKQNQGATSPCSSTGGCQGCGQCHGTLPTETANLVWGSGKDRMVNKKDGLGISHISTFCMFLCSTNHHPGLCFYSKKDEFDSGATS